MLLLALSAYAAGPFGLAGMVVTPAYELVPSTGATTRLESFLGPNVRVGWEVGNKWNHEFALQWTRAFTTGTSGSVDLTMDFSTYAFGYRFAWEALGKEGFTPHIGIGMQTGYAAIAVEGEQGGLTAFQDGGTFFLAFEAALGARYTMENGLNFRLDIAGNTYGGFMAIQPTIGVGWQFGRAQATAPAP